MKGIENVVFKGGNLKKAIQKVKALEEKGYTKKERRYTGGGDRVGNHVVLRAPGFGTYLIELVIFHSTKVVEMTIYGMANSDTPLDATALLHI